MRRFIAIALAAVLPTAPVAEPAETPGTAPIMAMGAYVPTDDMEGSKAFYRALFDSEPAIGLTDFVAFDVARGFWRTVNSTYGITRLVSFGKEPTAVPLDLVSQLMLRCDAKGKLLPPKLLKPGDQVTLTKGPFANFVAEVEKIAPDRRVWVLMEIMGAQTRVAVGADQLRAD